MGTGRVVIDLIVWSSAMVAKVGSKHGLSVQDVEHACERYRRAAWTWIPSEGVGCW